MSALFTPLTLRGVTFKNRVVVSPMCQYSSQDGFANDWHVVHLGTRAVGGAGLVIFEASAVDPVGRITPGDLGLYKDEHIPLLQRIVDIVHSHESKAGIQIAHAGRKASCDLPWKGGRQLALADGGWETVGPSAVPFAEGERPPHALTAEEIDGVVEAFAATARRALTAGFDVVEIHGAHGYLLSAFHSPLANHRTDEYGGSFENRIRLTLRVVDAVRAVWPDHLPLFLRVSATDWVEGGWTADDTVRLAAVVKQRGVDLMDCSSGGQVPHAKIPVGPGFQVQFAERVKKEAGLPSAAVGMITDAHQAEAIVASGQADLVMLARELLRNPYWPLHAAKALGLTPELPSQYLRSF
jgi:2,4-dienoyl-CoA reductase-like NADH-dependent reductase (Old Yellow Enzyme family)